jgi:hypothetical protein
MRTRSPAFAALLVVLSVSGCVRRVAMNDMDGPGPTEDPPRGMVELNVVSEYGDQIWDVYAGTPQAVCTTPCTQWFRPGQGLLLRSRDGDRIYVSDFGEDVVRAKRGMLIAEGTCHGKHINGIVFTSFGGMALITAIPLVAIGCSDPTERGMCNAGLITGGIALPLTAAAIWMLVDSLPKEHLLPVVRTQASKGQPPVTIAFAPTGIAGTF